MPTARILLVDDDRDVLEFLALHLRAAGLRVDTAESGAEAIDAVDRSRPDLVIADVMMPGMDGYELCRRLRALGRDDIPFIFCSVLADPPQRVEGLRLGADDYVGKPTDPEELLLRVHALLRRSHELARVKQRLQERRDGGIMAGRLDEVRLPDLLQIVDILGLDRVGIALDHPVDGPAEIHVRDRRVVHAAMKMAKGRRALFRMLLWSDGRFRIEREDFAGETTMGVRLDQCLLESLAQLDEYRALLRGMGSHECGLTVRPHTGGEATAIEEATRCVLSLVERHGRLDRVLDESPFSDLETLRILVSLVEAGRLARTSTC